MNDYNESVNKDMVLNKGKCKDWWPNRHERAMIKGQRIKGKTNENKKEKACHSLPLQKIPEECPKAMSTAGWERWPDIPRQTPPPHLILILRGVRRDGDRCGDAGGVGRYGENVAVSKVPQGEEGDEEEEHEVDEEEGEVDVLAVSLPLHLQEGLGEWMHQKVHSAALHHGLQVEGSGVDFFLRFYMRVLYFMNCDVKWNA